MSREEGEKGCNKEEFPWGFSGLQTPNNPVLQVTFTSEKGGYRSGRKLGIKLQTLTSFTSTSHRRQGSELNTGQVRINESQKTGFRTQYRTS